MKQLFGIIQSLLTLLDPQLIGLTSKLRLQSPTIYTILVALLFGADKWIYEAQKAGQLTLNETGVFIAWLVSFLVALFTRPVTPSVSNDNVSEKRTLPPDVREINKPSDIILFAPSSPKECTGQCKQCQC